MKATATLLSFLALLVGCSGVPVKDGSGSVSPPGGALPAPVLVSPEAGAVFDHFPRATVLKWEPVPGAASYSVDVDCFHCCKRDEWCADIGKSFLYKRRLRDTTHSFNWVGKNRGRWRVWAVSAEGTPGEMSPWREFDYTR